MKSLTLSAFVLSLLCLSSVAAAASPPDAAKLPKMRWGGSVKHQQWNADALAALRSHGQVLPQTVPKDIESWCPYYREADVFTREAFWIGFLSALSKHESTYNQAAVGGGGRWFGLVQISPGTARGYGCRARSGKALKDGGNNLSCAIRIMSVTVPRDNVIAGRDIRWRGVAADWGPLTNSSKRSDMAKWLQAQPYCTASITPQKKKTERRKFNSSKR